MHGIGKRCSNPARSILLVPHVYWRIVAIYMEPITQGVVGRILLWSGIKLD
jgi:hypothetical protein